MNVFKIKEELVTHLSYQLFEYSNSHPIPLTME